MPATAATKRSSTIMEAPTDMPTSQEWTELNRTIGGLVSAVDALKESVKDQQESSEQGRRRLHEKFEQSSSVIQADMRIMTGTVSGLATRLDSMDARLKKVETPVEGFRDDQLRKEGAASKGRAVWAWFAWGGALVGYALHELPTWIMKPPHG